LTLQKGPHSTTWENLETFYFPSMIEFANSKFIFAIKGPKLARKVNKKKNLKHNIGGFFFYLHP